MNFKLIAITLPEFHSAEACIISRLLGEGVIDRVHIRKPGADAASLRKLIESIPADLRPRLSLHDCTALAVTYGCGIHLNGRNPIPPDNFSGIISRSCHSVIELGRDDKWVYQFLSPIYPSISKPGYAPTFSLSDLEGCLPPNTVALGGVMPDKLPELKATGFDGAAMLGYIWEMALSHHLPQLIDQLRCCNS